MCRLEMWRKNVKQADRWPRMKTQKQKVAKVSLKQCKTIKTRARNRYDFLGTQNWNLVLDDETYAKAPRFLVLSTLPRPVKRLYLNLKQPLDW